MRLMIRDLLTMLKAIEMFGTDSNNRFKTIHKERTGTSGCNVIVDKETGVHYLVGMGTLG